MSDFSPDEKAEFANSIANAIETIREKIESTMPKCREIALVMTKLDEALLWWAESVRKLNFIDVDKL